MALFDRVKVTTATTGTGALTLGATGVRDSTNGDALSAAEAGIANQLVPYFITSAGNFAEGQGLVSSDGLTLTRDANERNWNGTTWAAGLLSLTGTSTVSISPRGVDLTTASMGATLAVRMGALLA